MAHLLRQMYVDGISFEAVTIEKIVDLVFTEMIHDKVQQLEKEELAKQDQTDGNHRSRLKKCSEVLNHGERWITYAEQALSEITLKHCLICHVLFGFRYILNKKEQSVLAILLTILFVCVN